MPTYDSWRAQPAPKVEVRKQRACAVITCIALAEYPSVRCVVHGRDKDYEPSNPVLPNKSEMFRALQDLADRGLLL